jgi:hypothetical protein
MEDWMVKIGDYVFEPMKVVAYKYAPPVTSRGPAKANTAPTHAALLFWLAGISNEFTLDRKEHIEDFLKLMAVTRTIRDLSESVAGRAPSDEFPPD